MFVKAREGEPFEELYRRFKRGIEASGLLREYRQKQRFKRPMKNGGTRSEQPHGRETALAKFGRRDR